jgi:hypothetical protein
MFDSLQGVPYPNQEASKSESRLVRQRVNGGELDVSTIVNDKQVIRWILPVSLHH